MEDPQLTMGFTTKSCSKDLDDLGAHILWDTLVEFDCLLALLTCFLAYLT